MANITENKYDFKIHPLCALFPNLPPEEFKKLKNDIQAHGQQEPITLSLDGTVLLDGRHRLKACKELGIQPKVERFSHIGSATRPISEADYIWSKNVLRRHLTDDQRAMLGVQWSDAIRESAKQRMRDGGKGLVGSPNLVHTRETIAKKAGVSTHKVRQAEAVAKKSPDLSSKVAAGETKLRDAQKTADAQAQKGQPQRAQKYDYDKTAFAVETTLKQIEKIITGARQHIPSNQYASYNDAVATRLETLAKRLRGKTAETTIDVSEERVQ
jgi:ParB-like nuclease family protein